MRVLCCLQLVWSTLLGGCGESKEDAVTPIKKLDEAVTLDADAQTTKESEEAAVAAINILGGIKTSDGPVEIDEKPLTVNQSNEDASAPITKSDGTGNFSETTKESQDAAVAAIEELGGKVTFDEQNSSRPLVGVDLSNSKTTDAGLVHLKGMTSLKSLNLLSTKVTDAGLVHLKGLTGLQTLTLHKTQVTPTGVKDLQAALPKCRIGLGDSVAQPNGDPTSKQGSNIQDSFDGKSLAPLWKSYSHDGLIVEESDGVAKIYGIVPSFPERYVRAGFELNDAILALEPVMLET